MSNTGMVNHYYDFITNDERRTFEGACVGVYSKLSSALPDLNKACTQTLTTFVATDIAAISGIIRWAGYKIRSITTQSHGLKSSDFFGL